MAERIGDGHPARVVPAVADEEALAVVDAAEVAEEDEGEAMVVICAEG